jgi:hypothetical protein
LGLVGSTDLFSELPFGKRVRAIIEYYPSSPVPPDYMGQVAGTYFPAVQTIVMLELVDDQYRFINKELDYRLVKPKRSIELLQESVP